MISETRIIIFNLGILAVYFRKKMFMKLVYLKKIAVRTLSAKKDAN